MKYIFFIAATIVGLLLRSTICTLNGWAYSINGADLVVAVAALVGAKCAYDLWFKDAVEAEEENTDVQ